MMYQLPLQLRNGHLFVELNSGLYLLDTGAPSSFGTTSRLSIADETFDLQNNYLGLTAATLSQSVGVRCEGLLGADILGRFDHLFDVPGGTLTFSKDELILDGKSVDLDIFMGIPIVQVQIRGVDYRMFFDTGAQVSYLQADCLASFPATGIVKDFYPGFGEFETETHNVGLTISTASFVLRCGKLPDLLGLTLMMANTQGIVGNQILSDRTVGYFPKRRRLVL